MKRTEIAAMFEQLSRIDPKVRANPDRDAIDAWHTILDDVPLEAAQEAVRDYYRSEKYQRSHDTITPGDIYGHYRTGRREQLEREHSAAVAADRAAIENPPVAFRSLAAEFAAQKATAAGDDPSEARRDAESRQRVLAVPCPHPACRAGRGQQCTSFTGRPLQRGAGHPSRLVEAGVEQQVR